MEEVDKSSGGRGQAEGVRSNLVADTAAEVAVVARRLEEGAGRTVEEEGRMSRVHSRIELVVVEVVVADKTVHMEEVADMCSDMAEKGEGEAEVEAGHLVNTWLSEGAHTAE